MSFHFAHKNALKIYLKIDEQEAGKRLFDQKMREKDSRKEEQPCRSIKAAIQDLRERKQIESRRYTELYGVDIHDTRNYDLIIDTTEKTPDEVVKEIMNAGGFA
jgi:cytidylate kinase